MNHFEPKTVIITGSFQFHHRDQAVGEMVAKYEVELCKLSTHCALKTTFQKRFVNLCMGFALKHTEMSFSRRRPNFSYSNRNCSRNGSG